MSASYIYRMDDITAGMDWDRFWLFLDLFRRHGVVPLLAVVPDNRDPQLTPKKENPDFWKILRQLKDEGSVEIAQHGYQHVYETWQCGLLGRKYGFRPQSEFVGLSYERQREKIVAGAEILRRQGLATDTWIAPAHSFDDNTLKALKDVGFGALSDGVALQPYRRNGLVFVPQQLWRPRRCALGLWTICLHTNELPDAHLDGIRAHLEAGNRCIRFSEAREFLNTAAIKLLEPVFRTVVVLNALGRALRQRLPRRPTPRG